MPIYSLDSRRIQIFVHGSWADNTRTSFSDLDDFVIVDDDYVEMAKPALDEVEVTFQRIDPLQHHGHWLIRRSQLSSYDNSYMPLFILKNSLKIWGNGEITATILDGKSKRSFINNVKITCRNIRELFGLYFKGELNIYKLKALVGSIALLPPLLFQIQDRFLDKKEAISKSNELFDEAGLELIKWATELRRNWQHVIDDSSTKQFFEKIRSLSNANQMRLFASENAPVLDYSSLSNYLPTKTVVNSFLIQCMKYVDKVSLEWISQVEYEDGYNRVEKEAIKLGALVVGKFGAVSHPGISDLDSFICFPDSNFKYGCEKITQQIEMDYKLSYLFKHPPFFITESCLDDVRNIHTLFNANVTFQSPLVDFEVPNKEGNKDFLFLLWTYLIYDLLINMDETEVSFMDSRELLLILKMIHTSSDFLNYRFNLGFPKSIDRSSKLRNTVLKENGVNRDKIIKEFLDSKMTFLLRVKQTGTSFSLIDEIFVSSKYVIKKENNIEKWQKKNVKYGIYYQALPPIFFSFIRSILFEKNKEAVQYIRTWRKLLIKSEELGTKPDSFTLVIPKEVLFNSLVNKISAQIRYLLKTKIKKVLYGNRESE